MAEAVCEACGSRNPATAEFCRACGAYLGWDGAARLLSDAEIDAEDRRRRRSAAGPQGQSGGAATTDPRAVEEAAGGALRPPCPVCGTRAEAGRSFCRRCGHALSVQPLPAQAGAPRVRWWRRWRSREAEQARAARAAYRRSLPGRYRLTRVLTGVAVVSVVGAAVVVADQDPVGRVRSAVADLRGTTSPVAVEEISTAPPDGELPGHPARHAVDAFSDSWWATSMPTGGAQLGTTCDAPGDSVPAGVLDVELAQPTVLRELLITPGPPEEDPRASTWSLPTAVVVRVDDGSCTRFALEPEPTRQTLGLRVRAQRLRIAVVAVAPAEEPVEPPVTGLAGLELRSRGG